MKLWTIQDYTVFEILKTQGSYCYNKTSLMEDCFESAYRWIGQQMKQKVGNPPKGIEFPIWAWYRIDGWNKRPDMRKAEFKVAKKSVLLEIEIPDNEVLLTDFDNWHNVIYDAIYYDADDRNLSEEEWEKAVEKEDAYYETLSEEQQRTYKEKSWERIICSSHSNSLPDYVQATFWELKKEQIRKAWILK